MTLNIAKVRQYLTVFDFETLFIEELGWDRTPPIWTCRSTVRIIHLRGFAEKRGVQVFECQAETAAKMPDFKTQRKIETQLAPRCPRASGDLHRRDQDQASLEAGGISRP